jgi:phosphate starvation-inducible PhoH-like protein
MTERTVSFRSLDEERALFGSLDRNLHLLRRLYRVDAVSRGGVLTIAGEPGSVEEASQVVEDALTAIRSGRPTDHDEVERILRRGAVTKSAVEESGPVRPQVDPRTKNQSRYVEAIDQNIVTFGIGPAGTGKSYLAVAMAAAYLRRGMYRRVVLCRPAVEAGENLGFLPGDLAAKITPYLRPLYDALHALVPRQQLEKYMESGVIEILPLAYMRGRTLDHSVIILDEAQNCTDGQMKMALTRIGRQSKMIVTGDMTQVDLPGRMASGLVTAKRILGGIEGIAFVHMTKADVMRHPVVAEIVRAYSRLEDGGMRTAAIDRIQGTDRDE